MAQETLNYPLDPVETLVLQFAVAELNAQPNSGNPPAPDTAWTPQTFVAAFGTSAFIYGQSQRPDILSQMLTAALTAFPAASQSNQAIVLDKLGLAAYETLSPEALIPIFESMGLPAFLQLSQADKVAVFEALGLGS